MVNNLATAIAVLAFMSWIAGGGLKSDHRFMVISGGIGGVTDANNLGPSPEAAARSRATDVFGVLGHETRLAIILVLWETKIPGVPLTEQAMPFTELRERVGTRDSGQFNYHLDKLLGPFVERTTAGYVLTERAEQILHGVMAGTFTDASSFENEPIDARCEVCGGPVVIDYRDGIMTERCTSCPGLWVDQTANRPGLLSRSFLPPVGLANRTPQAFHRLGNTWNRHRYLSMIDGVCPACAGTVSSTVERCENHDVVEGAVCERCGSRFAGRSLFVCDVCKLDLWVPAWFAILAEMAVTTYLFEHGIDWAARLDDSTSMVVRDAIVWEKVLSDDPVELEYRLVLDGDRLEVTLDDTGRVARVRSLG